MGLRMFHCIDAANLQAKYPTLVNLVGHFCHFSRQI